uniref:Nuclear nucleic acid-binding protein C1D n=1 Tax=Grammatophora oceanica TaxID=210454 RepID=A0A7S1Y762_9STRA|mmetsp:Transcript_32540/g.48254  ORF Transcript_32540/g.48254 Transcript_32540/m.48254 type:complete len:143 (+) Transcript_32540:36-464(+)
MSDSGANRVKRDKQSLATVRAATAKIRLRLRPFVGQLQGSGNDKARAHAVMALSAGTLRFMHTRLRGQIPDGSFRQELNHIRQVLRKVENSTAGRTESKKPKEHNDITTSHKGALPTKNNKKRGKTEQPRPTHSSPRKKPRK